MRISREDVQVQMAIPGATARLEPGFGTIGGTGISAEYFSLAAGVDTTPLFEGLEGDLCQAPHWGYVLKGRITTTDGAGTRETVVANDLFYWPPGHNVRVDEDADIVMFSAQQVHLDVIGHMKRKVGLA